jgi:UDP-N-acetylglucosamine transferase subunit ALG13
MIFVTVGTHTQPFNRLLKKIDELIQKGEIKEKVIAQIGNSTYRPRNYEYFKFTNEEKILKLNKEANLVITHAGVGSIITALQFKKSVVVVPRLREFNEHTNDHQIQIAKIFHKQKKILVCYNCDKLGLVIKKAKKFKPNIRRKEPKMLKIIKNFLEIQERQVL